MSSRWIRGPLVLTDVTVFTGSGNVAFANEAAVVVLKASGAATQVTLPPSPALYQACWVVDGKGDAATNNVTVVGASAATINGAANLVLSENYAAAQFLWNGTEWNVVGRAAALSATELGYLNGVTAGTVTASKALVVDANKDVGNVRNVTYSGGGPRVAVGTVAAAGSVQGDAAALAEGLNTVTASDGTKGVVLPTAVAGMEVIVVNTVSAQNLKVYPASGGTVDFGSANAAKTVAGQKTVTFRASSATQWYSILTA